MGLIHRQNLQSGTLTQDRSAQYICEQPYFTDKSKFHDEIQDIRQRRSTRIDALGAESLLLTENVQELLAPTSDRKEFSFAVGVAAFGMVLRGSEYKGTADFDMAYDFVGCGLNNDPHGYREELQELIKKAKGLAE